MKLSQSYISLEEKLEEFLFLTFKENFKKYKIGEYILINENVEKVFIINLVNKSTMKKSSLNLVKKYKDDDNIEIILIQPNFFKKNSLSVLSIIKTIYEYENPPKDISLHLLENKENDFFKYIKEVYEQFSIYSITDKEIVSQEGILYLGKTKDNL